MPDATLQDGQGRDLARVSVADAADMLAAVKSTASKGLSLDTGDATTISGFLSGGPDDAQVASKLSEAELYWYFANHHPWIGSATELIALTISGAGFDIVAPGADRDQAAVDKDPRVLALRVFLGEINPEQSAEDMVEELSLDRDIVGRFFVHILRLPNGKMVGLERLDSRTTAPVLTPDGRKIAKFVQKTRVRGRVITTEYATEDIIFGKRAGGADVLGRGSPIEELDLTLGVDWGARKHTAAYFRNAGSAGIIAVNKRMDKDERARNEKTLESRHTGADNAYKMLMLAGDWDISRPTTDGDEEFGDAQDRARQEICAVYHVPEAKLMTTEGALGGNGKDADDQTFHEECVMPRARYIWRTLSRAIMREFGIADLAIQPKAKYSLRVSMIEKAVQLLQAGGSFTEARGLMELPKSAATVDLDMPIAQGLLKSAEAIITPPPPPTALPKPKPADEGPPAKKAGARDGGHTEALAAYVQDHLDDVDAAAARLAKKLRKARKAMIGTFADAAHLDIAVKSAAPDLPINPEERERIKRAINELDASQIGDAIFDESEALYDLGWRRARVLLDVPTGFNDPPVATINRLREDASAFSFLVADREKAALRDALATALESGSSIEHVTAALREVFAEGFHVDGDGSNYRETASGRHIDADAWSEMVARTEMSRASNAGTFDFYQAAGLTKIRWIAADGANTCDECAEADDTVVDIGDDFPAVDCPCAPAHPCCCCANAPADDDLDVARDDNTPDSEE